MNLIKHLKKPGERINPHLVKVVLSSECEHGRTALTLVSTTIEFKFILGNLQKDLDDPSDNCPR